MYYLLCSLSRNAVATEHYCIAAPLRQSVQYTLMSVACASPHRVAASLQVGSVVMSLNSTTSSATGVILEMAART